MSERGAAVRRRERRLRAWHRHERQPVDASALAFLEEAEEKDLAAEYLVLVRTASHDSPAVVERLREVVRWRHVLRQKGRGRKKKKKRKKRLPRSPRPHLVSGCCLRSTGARLRLPRTAWLAVDSSSCLGPGGFLGRIPRIFFVMVEDWTFYEPLYLAPTCSVPVTPEEHIRPFVFGSHLFGVRLWSTGLFMALSGDFPDGFRIQLLLVQHWFHVHVSLRRLLGWYVLAGVARHDTPHAGLHVVDNSGMAGFAGSGASRAVSFGVGRPAARSAWPVWIRRTSRCVGFLAVFP